MHSGLKLCCFEFVCRDPVVPLAQEEDKAQMVIRALMECLVIPEQVVIQVRMELQAQLGLVVRRGSWVTKADLVPLVSKDRLEKLVPLDLEVSLVPRESPVWMETKE